MNAIEIIGLGKSYPGFDLKEVTFSLPQGTILGLVGENGAGKSTTLKALLDLTAHEGAVTFWGKTLRDCPELKEQIGVVFDEIGWPGPLTVRQAGAVSAAAYSTWDQALFRKYLRDFRLPENKPVKALSKGMKMKLSIALALAHQPRLLILDEATAGLDPVMRDDLLEVLLDFVQDEEHAVLMSSHITTDLEKAADHIACIHKGRLLFCAPKDELLYKWGILRCTEGQLEALDKAALLAWRKDALSCAALVADREAAMRTWPELVCDKPTIEEIMLLYGKGETK